MVLLLPVLRVVRVVPRPLEVKRIRPLRLHHSAEGVGQVLLLPLPPAVVPPAASLVSLGAFRAVSSTEVFQEPTPATSSLTEVLVETLGETTMAEPTVGVTLVPPTWEEGTMEVVTMVGTLEEITALAVPVRIQRHLPTHLGAAVAAVAAVSTSMARES